MASIPASQKKTVETLYYKKGYSMADIGRHFQVSLNAVVYFMRHHKIKRRDRVSARKLSFERQPASFVVRKEFSADDLRLKDLGVALYWCEGYKTSRSKGIDFANSDPRLVRIFVAFLKKICGISSLRLKVLLYCYVNQSPDELISFWSRLLDIPKEQFSKPYIRHDFKMDKIGKMPYGLVHIRYHDVKLLAQVMEWIKEIDNTIDASVV